VADPSAKELGKDVLVVGASHRDMETDARQKLVSLDDGPSSPIKELVSGGHARAVLRIDTCARVEWVVVADKPEWAATLIEAACARRAGINGLHKHDGERALDYLFSVALGLDSVVEGESAIGRQVLLAFQSAHEAAPLDTTLRRLWHAISSIISEKRRTLATQYAGVERLVADAIVAKQPKTPVAVFGRGDIAKAILLQLSERGVACEPAYGRDTVEAFRAKLVTADCLVVASGAHEAWLDLPARDDRPLCVDVGSPKQVRAAGGFVVETLDDLFAGAHAQLEGDVRTQLRALVEVAIAAYRRPDNTTPEILAELMRHKAKLLEERLPPLLDAVSDPELKKKLRAEVQSFSHEMITSVRKGGQ
jgi:glutamyl-tRNA reductase